MNVSHKSKVLTLELKIVNKLCKEFNTPRSLAVALLIQNNEWGQLLDLSCDHRNYLDYQSFQIDYQVTSMLQKNPRLPTLINKRDVAIAKFLAAEEACKATNIRLESFYKNPHLVDPELNSVLIRSQIEIQKILGPFPTRKDLEYAEHKMTFGNGATTSVSGIVTHGRKYSKRTLNVTSRLLPFRTYAFPDLWAANGADISIRESSKLAVVPKNAKTDRVICIEPDLNIFVQLGIGALLKRKLLRSGLDLTTQDRNRELASRAYKDDLCTVDLSSASDTISREAVWYLLPPTWADLLYLARVDTTSINGVDHNLNKWSSMGNGYTFELETIIFYGISLAVCKHLNLPVDNVTTYGDDIIVPADAFELLQRTLNFLGFNVNSDKTFGKGSFHESCGADFFLGHNVRPFYLRTEHHDFETICYLYANNLRRWAHRYNNDGSADSRFLPAWLYCFTAVKPSHRHLIPEGVGDTGFIESRDRSKHAILYYSRRKGWEGFNYHYRQLKSISRVIDPVGSYLSFLNGKTTDFARGLESLRGRFNPPKTKIGYSLEWPNLGDWL